MNIQHFSYYYLYPFVKEMCLIEVNAFLMVFGANLIIYNSHSLFASPYLIGNFEILSILNFMWKYYNLKFCIERCKRQIKQSRRLQSKLFWISNGRFGFKSVRRSRVSVLSTDNSVWKNDDFCNSFSVYYAKVKRNAVLLLTWLL